jgi:WD40 repeat protein
VNDHHATAAGRLRLASFGRPLTGHTNAVWWGGWGQVDGRPVLATGSADRTVRLWDPATGTALGGALTGHTGPVYWGCWGQVDGRPVLATGGLDRTVRLWDPATGTALGGPLTGHTGPVLGLLGAGGRPAGASHRRARRDGAAVGAV